MSTTPWVRWFWSDYNADTAHLDLMQLGAYQRLLGYIYQRRQPLPGDPDKIFRLTHATSAMEQTAVRQVLQEYFVPDTDPERGECWRHLRAERELERAEGFSNMAAERAKKAAAARWDASSNASSNPQAKPKQCLSNATQNQNQNQSQKEESDPEPEPKTRACAREATVIPAGVDGQAWDEFLQHRREIRKPLTALAAKKAANLLSEHSPAEQRQMVDDSIRNRWTGLFPPKNKRQTTTNYERFQRGEYML